jgi:hypothetical protein
VHGNAWVSGDYDMMLIGPIGSRNGYTTVFRCKDGSLTVNCGCWSGELDAFAEAVMETHGDNKHSLAYRAMIDFAKVFFVRGES